MTTTKIPTYKLLLVGDGAVGKTSFIKKHRAGEFPKYYNATMGVEVHPLKFHTTKGSIIFNIWDCAGQDKFSGLGDGYYIQGHCAIIMFDHGSLLSLKNVDKWQRDVLRVVENVPMVLVGNKSDGEIKCTPTETQKQGFLDFHSVSAKTNKNYEKPFLTLVKHYLGEDTEFTD